MDDYIEDVFLDNDEKPPHRHEDLHPAVETSEEYKKLGYGLAGLLAISTLLTTIRGWDMQRFLADFAAVFFIGAAGFKFAHLEAFAFAYRSYDIIGSRLRPWAYGLPFMEAFLGFWYLLSTAPSRLNILTLLVTGTAAAGAAKALWRPRLRQRYPSLGGIFRLPLLRITWIEHLLLGVVAAALLIVG